MLSVIAPAVRCAFFKRLMESSALHRKGAFKVLQRLVMLILLAQKQLRVFRHRPVDSNFRVVPHQAALVAGIVKPGAFINELRPFQTSQQIRGQSPPARKTVSCFQQKAARRTLSIGIAALPQIHGDVVNLAADHRTSLPWGFFF